MKCTENNCSGIMSQTDYIGDGSGPAYDHIHYKCDKCKKVIEVLD